MMNSHFSFSHELPLPRILFQPTFPHLEKEDAILLQGTFCNSPSAPPKIVPESPAWELGQYQDFEVN